MTTQFRKLMQQRNFDKLKGHVEIDKTYVSTGINKSATPDLGRGTASKKLIVVVVQRLGEARAR